MDKGKIALLYDRSWTEAVPNELNNIEASFTIKLRKVKVFSMLDVAWNILINVLLFVLRNKPIKIDIWCKYFHVLSEVVVSVDLKNFDLDFLHIFNLNKDFYLFIYLKLFLVIVTKLNVGQIL